MPLIPWLVCSLVVVLVGLLGWGVWRGQVREGHTRFLAVRDDLLLGLLLLASFGLGVFVTYLLLLPGA
jgi:hypothetical protein